MQVTLKAAVIALALALSAVACSGSGSSAPDASEPDAASEAAAAGIQTINGEEVDADSIDVALAEAERLFADSTAAIGATVGADPACWFEAADQAGQITLVGAQPTIYCGPTRLLDGDTGVPYLTLPVRTVVIEDARQVGQLAVGDTEVAIAVDPFDLQPTSAQPTGLYRPDGRPGPTAEEIAAVELPLPPPVATGFIDVRNEEITEGLRYDTPDETLLPWVGVAAEITGLTTVDVIGEGPEALVAPPGEQFHIMRYRTYYTDVERTGPSVLTSDPNATATVEVDGGRFALPETFYSSQGTNTLVVSAPTDADVALEVSSFGLESRYDLTTGTTDHHPALGVEPIIDLDVEMPTQTISLQENSYTISWLFDHAVLTPYLPDLGPAPSGATWLVVVDSNVNFQGSDSFAINCEAYTVTFDHAGSQLTLPDGTATPVHHLIEAAFDGDGSAFVFQVPEDTTAAVASIQARYTYDNTCGDTGVFEGETVALEMTFPARRVR